MSNYAFCLFATHYLCITSTTDLSSTADCLVTRLVHTPISGSIELSFSGLSKNQRGMMLFDPHRPTMWLGTEDGTYVWSLLFRLIEMLMVPSLCVISLAGIIQTL